MICYKRRENGIIKNSQLKPKQEEKEQKTKTGIKSKDNKQKSIDINDRYQSNYSINHFEHQPLNEPTKRQIVRVDQKTRVNCMLSEVTHFKCKDMDEEYMNGENYIMVPLIKRKQWLICHLQTELISMLGKLSGIKKDIT